MAGRAEGRGNEKLERLECFSHAVRGDIAAQRLEINRRTTCSLLPDVQLFEYELSLKLNPVNLASSA
jgi:hypothetical protein